METESGHIKEYDDTTDKERIHEYHKKGTFYEIDKDGNKSTRIVGDNYEKVKKKDCEDPDFVNINLTANLTIDSNCNTYIKGNLNGNRKEWIVKTEVVTGITFRNLQVYKNRECYRCSTGNLQTKQQYVSSNVTIRVQGLT